VNNHISQTQKIYGYLLLHGSITPHEALQYFKCYRLGARIWELKKKGHSVQRELIEQNGSHFCKYTLVLNQG
jgi:hypothetical protein